MTNEIELVLFDLGEVYLNGMVGVERGIAPKVGTHEESVWRHLNGEKLRRLFKGMCTEDEYWAEVIQEGQYPAEIDDMPTSVFLAEAMRSNFFEINGTAETVRALKKAGYGVSLISDHVKEWIIYCEQNYPLVDLFDNRYYSFDSGYTKKSPHAFHYALQQAGGNPSKTLFVDDNPKNLTVAQSPQVGIAYTHQFTDANSLRGTLPRYGITI